MICLQNVQHLYGGAAKTIKVCTANQCIRIQTGLDWNQVFRMNMVAILWLGVIVSTAVLS